LLDENEINLKNLKKNFSLEKKVKELSDEISIYKLQLTEYDEMKNVKMINITLNKEIKAYKIEVNELKVIQTQDKKTVDKLKEDNFTKFEKVNNLENELRIKKRNF
jgi:hypothetical protein